MGDHALSCEVVHANCYTALPSSPSAPAMAQRSTTPPRQSLRSIGAVGLASVRARSPVRGGARATSPMRGSGSAAGFDDNEMAPALGGGMAGGAAPTEMESHAEALFRTVDRDGSGLISFEEFQSWWTRRTLVLSAGRQMDSSLMDEARAKWVELDSDGSGDLDAREFENLIVALASSDWKEAYDAARGKSYFYNKKTKETRWHNDNEAAVSDFLSQNGVAVAPRAKQSAGMAGIANAKRHASRLANSDSAKRAREVCMKSIIFSVTIIILGMKFRICGLFWTEHGYVACFGLNMALC